MIYCFDLDGTLCSQQDLDYENALPFVKRVKHVNDLYDDGHTIIIDTARGSGATKRKDWTEITEKQLEAWGVKYHDLRVGVKFSADVYIDDKADNADNYFEKCV